MTTPTARASELLEVGSPWSPAPLGASTQPESISTAADPLERTLSPADVIVADGGIRVCEPMMDITPAEFARCLEVNLTLPS